HPLSEVSKCNKSRLWNSRPASTSRIGNQIQTSNNAPLCISWQRPSSCSSDDHPKQHICSGCGGTEHGASSCPLAQEN
ncbi:uncharacterized protein TRAVEDRAFT_122620, partial [Trametes versicolor FP-101664 SS1]|uniref:uncharacterized protein n=1 Tax=Trametes versicolor (strain FP-101664) TaxID=717944 RepID=UPI00046241CF